MDAKTVAGTIIHSIHAPNFMGHTIHNVKQQTKLEHQTKLEPLTKSQFSFQANNATLYTAALSCSTSSVNTKRILNTQCQRNIAIDLYVAFTAT